MVTAPKNVKRKKKQASMVLTLDTDRDINILVISLTGKPMFFFPQRSASLPRMFPALCQHFKLLPPTQKPVPLKHLLQPQNKLNLNKNILHKTAESLNHMIQNMTKTLVLPLTQQRHQSSYITVTHPIATYCV
jgi:hypothetical protein